MTRWRRELATCNTAPVSTGAVIGAVLSAGYGILLAVLALAHVPGRTLAVVAGAGGSFLGLYWAFISPALS